MPNQPKAAQAGLRGLRISLPMYNLPEMRDVNTAFWTALRTELADVGIADTPTDLDFQRPSVPDSIGADNLFTQVCGYPLETIYRGQAIRLAVPAYDAPYCEGATHCGVFIVHRDAPYRAVEDLKGCHFVFNSVNSNSGMNLPRRTIADVANGQPFFAKIEETHTQPGNIDRVARHEADATCVDCVTYEFARRYRPHVRDNTRVLAATRPSPAIPFATPVSTPPPMVAALRNALLQVGSNPKWATVRAGLMLRGIQPADDAAYAHLLDFERQAADLGYPKFV